MLDVVMLALGLASSQPRWATPSLRTALDSDAFPSREPVSASLENALEEHNHDLRLFTPGLVSAACCST